MRKPRRSNLPAGTIDTTAAARVSGIQWRTLLRWVERGVLKPTLYQGERGTTGAAFAWNVGDLLAARTVAELRRTGLSAQRVQKAARAVARAREDLASARLVSDGADVFRVLPESRLMSMLRRPGQHLVFPLGAWMTETRERFEAEIRKRERRA